MIRLMVTLVALYLAPAAQAAAQADLSETALSRWADDVYGGAVRAGRIDGAVVSVVVDGKRRILRGYGVAAAAAHAPVNPEQTTFQLGSVSKTFAAVAVRQLQAQGRLPDLDAPVAAWLGARAPLGEPSAQISLRHLLTHQAGLEEQAFSLATRDQTQQTGPRARIVRPPGRRTSYSNTAFGLLSAAAENASGRSYQEVLSHQIFVPIGMSTARLRTTLTPDPSLALGAFRAPDGTRWPIPPGRMLRLDRAACGGVEASGRDMERYMIALLDRGASGWLPGLDPASFAPLFEEQARRHPAANAFGMVFFLSDWNGVRVIEHGGVLPGARAYLHLIPSMNVGIFTAVTGEAATPPAFVAPTKWRHAVRPGKQPVRLLTLSEMRAENLSMLLGRPDTPARIASPGSAFQIAGTYAPERRNRTSIERALDLVRADALVRRIEAVSPTRIRLDGREYVEISPHVFWREAAGTGDSMGFYDRLVGLPGASRDEDAFTFTYNDMDYVRAGPADNLPLQKHLLQFAALAGLSGALIWFSRRPDRLLATAALGMPVAGLAMAAVLYAGVGQNNSIISDWAAGDVGRAALLAVAGNVFALCALTTLVLSLNSLARRPEAGVTARALLTGHRLILAAAASAALFALHSVNLIGWNLPA